jgi:hypothetical protein
VEENTNLITKEAEDRIRKQAFHQELEKLGAVGLIAGALRALRPLWAGALKWAPKVTQTTSGKAVGRLAKRLGETGQRKRFFGKVGPKLNVAGYQKTTLGKVPNVKFLQNPALWLEKSVKQTLGRTAQNIETISKGGFKGFAKSKWNQSKYFSKPITTGGKTTNVLYKRSLPGRMASTAGTTGLGWGGLAFATSGKDLQTGQKNPLSKRILEGAKQTALWGALGPAYSAKIMTYDLPKMGLSFF